MIHPQAIVEDGALIGDKVTIGPFAVVEAGAQIGDGSTLCARSHISSRVVLGRECVVHVGAVLGGLPQDISFDPEVETGVHIGDRNVLRENVTVHRATVAGTSTVIGNDNYLMAQSHVAHDVRLGDHIIMANNALIAGHVCVADRAFISGNAVIHQFCRVGTLAMISGISGTGLDVPPFATVSRRNTFASLNLIGMRRAGYDGRERGLVKSLYLAIAAARGDRESVQQILGDAEECPAIDAIRAFYAEKSRRGILRPFATS